MKALPFTTNASPVTLRPHCGCWRKDWREPIVNERRPYCSRGGIVCSRKLCLATNAWGDLCVHCGFLWLWIFCKELHDVISQAIIEKFLERPAELGVLDIPLVQHNPVLR